MNPLLMQTLSFYCHRELLRSPSLSPHSLPVYVEALAKAYANASSNSTTNSPSPCRYHDTRKCIYFELSASESDDI